MCCGLFGGSGGPCDDTSMCRAYSRQHPVGSTRQIHQVRCVLLARCWRCSNGLDGAAASLAVHAERIALAEVCSVRINGGEKKMVVALQAAPRHATHLLWL